MKKYTTTQKTNAMKWFEQGKSATWIHRKTGIPVATLYFWKRSYSTHDAYAKELEYTKTRLAKSEKNTTWSPKTLDRFEAALRKLLSDVETYRERFAA